MNKSFVTEQVKRLAYRFNNLPWAKDESGSSKLRDEYERVIAALVGQYGESRTEKAVTAVIDTDSFLEPSKIMARIPLEQAVHCRNCARTEGWIYVQIATEQHPRALRCPHVNVVHTQVVTGPNYDRKRSQADVVPIPPISDDTEMYSLKDVFHEARRRWPDKFGVINAIGKKLGV